MKRRGLLKLFGAVPTAPFICRALIPEDVAAKAASFSADDGVPRGGLHVAPFGAGADGEWFQINGEGYARQPLTREGYID